MSAWGRAGAKREDVFKALMELKNVACCVRGYTSILKQNHRVVNESGQFDDDKRRHFCPLKEWWCLEWCLNVMIKYGLFFGEGM